MRRLGILFVASAVLVALGGCIGPCLPPIASFAACPNGSSGDFTMQFSSTSQNSNGHALVFFRWDFGDGTKVDDYYGWTSHQYESAGTYTVSLTVTDDRGVTATHEESVTVEKVVELGDVTFGSGYPSRAVGEIANLSTFFLYSATIKVKFYDPLGVRVAETTVEVDSIDPGERVRFVAEAPSDVGTIATASALVESFSAECAGGSIPSPVYNGK